MAKADRVYITPPTNTPVDTTRRRFLAVAAVASIVGAGQSCRRRDGAERRPEGRHRAQVRQAGSGLCTDRG